MKYIVQLSEEIQAMEGGDLDHPITVQGSDELTTLASSLDSMRLTLRQQHEDEAAAAAKVKNLITEMSHDLRTPLTTLLLYTEILRHRKYETTAQAEDYLAKIDTKARQLKQLSDNLFEYALVTRDTVAVLDPPTRFSQIFEEPLTEMVGELQERSFACALDLGEEDDTLTVKEQYVHRILDNITSNLLKYADPAQDISVRFVKENGKAGLAFANAVLPGRHQPLRHREVDGATGPRQHRQAGRGLGHDFRLVTEDLHGGRMFVRRRPEQLLRFFIVIDQRLGAHHFRAGEGSALCAAQRAKWRVGHARHGRERERAADLDITDLHHVISSSTGQWSLP